jgi:hypothetical protein
MDPQPEPSAPNPAEGSPLWPLVVLLGEIAIRIEREQAATGIVTPTAAEPVEDAA